MPLTSKIFPSFRLNNISALQFFNIIRFGTTILIAILLAKSGLPTHEIAIYEGFLFFANFASFFWVGGGQNALLQFFPGLENDSGKKALFNTWLVFLGLSLIASGALFFFQNHVLKLTNFDTPPPFDLLCLFLIFNTPAWLTHVIYLLLNKHRHILFYAIISFGLQVLVVMLPLWFGLSLRAVFWGLVILAIAKFLWSLIIVVRETTIRFDLELIKNYLLLALPLILHVLIGNSVEYVDGFIVTSHFDESAFAIFRYGAKEFPLALLLIGAVAMALIPEVAQNPKKGLEKIKTETERLARWLFPMSMVLMLLSPFLFPIVFNPDFKESARVFNVYLLIISSRILLPQVVLLAHQKNYYLVISAIIETILNVSLSLILVKDYGLEGIAFATVIAYLANKIIMVFFNWKLLKIPPGRYIHFRNYLIYNGLLFGSYFLSLAVF